MKKEPTIEDVKKFYDEEHTKHQSKWLHKSNPRIAAVLQFAIPQIRSGKYSNLLDLGCGVGIITKALAEYMPTIMAIDLSESNIATAQEYKSHRNIIYNSGDFTRMNLGGPYNVVCAFDVVEHIRPSDREAFLINARLHCNGIMLVAIPNPEVIVKIRETDPEILQIVDEPVYDADFHMFSIHKKLSVGKYIYYILKP